MSKNSNNVSDLDTKTGAEASENLTASEKKQSSGGTDVAYIGPNMSGGKITKESVYVYIGPSLPGAKLMTNTVISGTRKQISEYYKDVIDSYPNVDKLIVPVDKLSESRAKVSAGGNILSKYYNDLLIQIRKGAVK